MVTVSEIEGLHVGLQVGGGLLLRHVGESGHLAVKVEELSVCENGQVILEGSEFLLGGQVGGRGHRVQVCNVLRHVGCATGAVGRHGGRKWAAGARRRRYLVGKSEEVEAGCIGDIRGSLGVAEGRGMVACFGGTRQEVELGVPNCNRWEPSRIHHMDRAPAPIGSALSALSRSHTVHHRIIVCANPFCPLYTLLLVIIPFVSLLFVLLLFSVLPIVSLCFVTLRIISLVSLVLFSSTFISSID
jgi:hypothetical protein